MSFVIGVGSRVPANYIRALESKENLRNRGCYQKFICGKVADGGTDPAIDLPRFDADELVAVA